MNILVIGAAGLIGSHLIKNLSSLRYRASAMDIDSARVKWVLESNVPFYCCDFGAQSTLHNVLKRKMST